MRRNSRMKSEVEIIVNENMIAFCGLYCPACSRFLKEKCEGCNENKASWCKVKPCNKENNYLSCAECQKYESVAECKKFNPLLIRFGELISRTNRKLGIQLLKVIGRLQYAQYMAKNKFVSIKKVK
jgi:hypothetical protein